jgi:predicted GH43/DUF377 family glycosyl hydrolase
MTYQIKHIEPLIIKCSEPLSGMYKLSPFVWTEKGWFKILLRAVNPSQDPKQKVARIYYGTSRDGLTFKMSDTPVIVPGTNVYDKDGCEDPTLVFADDQYFIYYSGWNQTEEVGQLLLSKGSSIETLKLAGVAIPSQKGYRNPKEATVYQLPNKEWVLWFEYADDDRSKLGMAKSSTESGPWKIIGEYMQPGNEWDNYHLSAGPIVKNGNEGSVMFYNGANEKAHWRIGWVEMDGDGNVTNRSTSPLITPTKPKKDETDIAFAASALMEHNEIWLYYSVADSKVMRAIITIDK